MNSVQPRRGIVAGARNRSREVPTMVLDVAAATRAVTGPVTASLVTEGPVWSNRK